MSSNIATFEHATAVLHFKESGVDLAGSSREQCV
jgi:hypothetical protein